MDKEFSFESSYFEYAKNYFKIYSISFILLIAVLIRVYNENWGFKNELFWGLLIGFPILLFISSYFHFLKITKTKYIFTNNTIVLLTNGNTKTYYISDIIDVIKPKKRNVKNSGIDYIKIEFKDGKKITFGNTLPYYKELKLFLENYLSEKLDYTIRQV